MSADGTIACADGQLGRDVPPAHLRRVGEVGQAAGEERDVIGDVAFARPDAQRQQGAGDALVVAEGDRRRRRHAGVVERLAAGEAQADARGR